jgi:hypothetical protein
MNGMLEGLRSMKGYFFWAGKVERKIIGGKIGIVVGEYQWVVRFYEL